jgi:hypothetical protein
MKETVVCFLGKIVCLVSISENDLLPEEWRRQGCYALWLL